MNWKTDQQHSERDGDGRLRWVPYRIWRGADVDTRPLDEQLATFKTWARKQKRTSWVALRHFADVLWMNAVPIIRMLESERQIIKGTVPVSEILVENEALRKAFEDSRAEVETVMGEYRPALREMMKATAFVDTAPVEEWPQTGILLRLTRESVIALHPEFAPDPATPSGSEPLAVPLTPPQAGGSKAEEASG